MLLIENFLYEFGDKFLNMLEFGYYLERVEDELFYLKYREKVSKKKKYYKDVGLENKGFEFDGE